MNGNTIAGTGQAQVSLLAPGLFSADATGQGLAAAFVLRVKADGTQLYEAVATYNSMLNKFIAQPIDLGPPTDKVFLILFGTGLRGNSSIANVRVILGGLHLETLYAGPQGSLVGLDQVNLLLPRVLAGRGDVDVSLSLDSLFTNIIKINLK